MMLLSYHLSNLSLIALEALQLLVLMVAIINLTVVMINMMAKIRIAIAITKKTTIMSTTKTLK